MRIGAATTIDEVTASDWDTLAGEIGISKGLVARTRRALALRIAENIDASCEQLVREGAARAVLERASAAIALRARAVASGERLPDPPAAVEATGEPWQR